MAATAAPFDLGGRVALVTGAARGIGAGIADVLSAAGATVIVADRDHDAAARHAHSLNQRGFSAEAIGVEMSEENSIVTTCSEVVRRFGTPWLLVNNAGVQDRELLLEASASEFDRIMAINARGPFLLIREIATAMKRAGGGRIVNIGSASLEGLYVNGLAAYVSSKGALLALARAAATEFMEHHITVNTVLPGAVFTPGAFEAHGPPPKGPGVERSGPLGVSDPVEIGFAVAFFASPFAHRITNQTLCVDGGFLLT